MEMSELTAYAKERYGMEEEHKWTGFPGFSVLCHPHTGKWAALLMRQYDSESGQEIERCDLKCGTEVLREMKKPYLSKPFRMPESRWIGIAFTDETEPSVVFSLFDRAIGSEPSGGYTIVLEPHTAENTGTWQDTLLSFAGVTKGFPEGYTFVKKERHLPETPGIPPRILEMMRLYVYGDGSLEQKAINFYRQGKFMEDYEDDAVWNGEFHRPFPTYHDLNGRQLRGYFSWRSQVRKGNYSPTTSAFVYLYLYELLCGIGCASPEDVLEKMNAFEKGYLDAKLGDLGMRKNLFRWRFAYAVIHGFPPEMTQKFVDPHVLQMDTALAALREPESHTDAEIVSALCGFSEKKFLKSPVLTKDPDMGTHLVAAVWRHLTEQRRKEGQDAFTDFFGTPQTHEWFPLSNAIYYEPDNTPPRVLALNACRSYRFRDGEWEETCYEPYTFDRNRFYALMHETDRLIRKALKTGRSMRAKPEETWATPIVEAALEAEHRAEMEASRPKIRIDFSGLDKIRQDAIITRDSLLTEEEREETTIQGAEMQHDETGQRKQADDSFFCPVEGLDEIHGTILMRLLKGLEVGTIIREHHLMPSVVTDTINEALFEEIGDSALEYDGDRIQIIEDYRDDVMNLAGGQNT
ncbi:MAG: TerB N-terminal domain-containing protein [Clostridia bacterium]|nr:TerB N-terminal domain-containing protein [Clostridia bacterium]